MSYRELIYRNALNEVERIYHDSKYNPSEDLYRSLDIMTAIHENRLQNYDHLVNILKQYLTPKYLTFELQDVLVMGSLYGVFGMALRQQIDNDIKIWNVDSDPEYINYQRLLQHGNDDYENNIPITEDALEYYFDRADAFQLIISTDYNMDIDDAHMILQSKPIDTIACFQGNYIKSLKFAHVYYKDENTVIGI